MIFSAARLDHLEKLIEPALARGAFVICDRFADSTRAYQGGRLPESFIDDLERLTIGARTPDLTIMLDLPAETGLERASRRRGTDAVDRFEAEDIFFHRALRDAFGNIAKRNPGRCMVLDAARTPDEIAKDIWRIVEQRFLSGAQT